MRIFNLGVGDKSTQDLENTVQNSHLTEKELLECILIELKIMNVHNSEITGLMIKREDIDNDY